MAGMEVPQPGGTMKKMSFEFTDPAAQEAAQAPQIPQGAGIPPTGMQGGIPPTGMTPQDQGQQNPMFSQAGGPQGGDTSALSDMDLESMINGDPNDMYAEDMHSQLMGDQVDPMLQMQMMEAARRRLNF